MRLAIPISFSCVAPRFSVAESLLLVDIADDRRLDSEWLITSPGTATGSLRDMARRGTTHLLCGGFNRRYLPTASALGIAVIWGQAGPAEELVERFVLGDLPEPINLPELRMNHRIAITVTDERGLDGVTDPRFGRAAGQGGGTGAAALMAKHGVTDVISGHFGPKAAKALEGLEIAMWLVEGGAAVSAVLRRHGSGELPRQH